MTATLALLGGLASRVDVSEVGRVLTGVDPALTAGGLAIYFVLQAVRALRFRSLAPTASTRLLLGAHLVHALLLRVMPFRTGELGFAWLMRRHGGGTMSQSLVGVLLVRVLDLTTILGLFAVALLVFGGAPAPWLLGAAGLGALAPLGVRPLFRLAGHVVARAATLGDRLAGPAAALERAFVEAAALPARTLAGLHAITLVQWVVNFGLLWVMLAAMGVEATLAQAVLGGTGSVFGALVPVAGVGSFGPLEAGWSLGFAAVGLEAETAIASAFGFSVISFGYALATAATGWVMLPARNPSND